MSVSNLNLLRHILDEINFILKATEGKTKEAAVSDPVLSRALIRSLEIIGEASRKIEEAFKSKYPEVEWKKMAGTRNRLIHDYFGVDYDIVYDIIENKLPKLKILITSIINEVE